MTAVVNPLSTIQTDPIRNFKFLVTIAPHNVDATWKNSNYISATGTTMGFVSVAGLSISTESIAYREGGYNTNVHQIPGQTSFTPITLSKGILLGQNDNMLWMKRLFAVNAGSATTGVGADFRVDLDIAVLSHPNPAAITNQGGTVANNPADQHVSMRFKVYNAWITSLAFSSLDAGANSLMVEEMQLVHEGFDVSYAKDYTATAPAIS